jgi:FtsZ-binding cell division protein ZapB
VTGPQKPKRIRKRSLRLQLEQCLRDAEAAATADISTQKLVQTRLTTLTRLLSRERLDKLKQATDTIAVLRVENAQLRERLNAVGTTARPVDPVISRALEKYHAENGGHHAGNNQSSSDSNAG